MNAIPPLACVLLAAGNSTRFGSCKQLATIDFKKTLLEHTLTIADKSAPDGLCLVLGANKADICHHIDFEKNFPRVKTLTNPRWREGMGTSIALAVRTLARDFYQGVMILLADHIAISAEQLNTMRKRWYQEPQKIIVARYDDVVGCPAIFPSSYFDKLISLQGDQGARRLIREGKHQIVEFPLAEAAQDIDTENQLNHWQIENLLHDTAERSAR